MKFLGRYKNKNFEKNKYSFSMKFLDFQCRIRYLSSGRRYLNKVKWQKLNSFPLNHWAYIV
jgi:hypothetical protein